MPIKTILLPIRESDTADALMETGVAAAVQIQAHLDLLYVRAKPDAMLPFATLGLTASLKRSIAESTSKSAMEEERRLRERFETVCAARGVPIRSRGAMPGDTSVDFVAAEGMRNELIARYGRLADLVIVPRPFRVSPPPHSFEAALRETGRPVLMVPREQSNPMTMRTVAIGWNGSKEAAQAIAAARPYLRRADTVHILSTSKRMEQRPNAQDVSVYLACHGIESSPVVFDSRSRSVGQALLEESRALGGDLLVVGGYSRARLRDMVVGGVTGHLAEHADIPVLMVH